MELNEDREKKQEEKRESKRASVRARHAKNKKSEKIIKTSKNELEEKQKNGGEKSPTKIEISTFAYMVGWTIPKVCAYIAEKKIRVSRCRKYGDWWIPESALNGLEIIHPLESL